MITIFHDDLGHPHVRIGITKAEIDTDKASEGIEHTPVPTTAHGAVRFLESLQELSPDSILQIESLLTAVYKTGVEAGIEQHKDQIRSTL